MAATPDPTPATVFSIGAGVSGRLSPAIAEIRRRLQANLPTLFAYALTEFGVALPNFSGPVRLAPSRFDNQFINTLSLGLTDAAGITTYRAVSPSTYQSSAPLSLYLVDRRAEIDEQLLSLYDRADVITRYLKALDGPGVSNPDDVRVWRMLTFLDIRTLPGELNPNNQVSGVVCDFKMLLTPDLNLWS